ncbi:hypothetical protein C8R41DRAFT_919063 [Lentinula lateritia]|uniref:Uncharacterized protein n=1 Tax=Lentinula lateritia TaxID=40482 RepID=A0ABQ8VHH2_9AGAR|nr:hypothetical protein C8R41DRAFT_919063 [Lentinula lateritia]
MSAPTTPSTSSARRTRTLHSIHQDHNILVALLEKDVKGVSAVNKEMQKAKVGVDAANIRLEEKLNQVELDIKEIWKLTSPPSTPTCSWKVKHIPSLKNLYATPRSPLPAMSNTRSAERVIASPSKQNISLVWISLEDEANCPDDSEDSDTDDSGDGWIPQSAADVSSDEDEPLPGLGGVTAAEASARKASKSGGFVEKTYLVYYGRNNSDGLYFKWQGTNGATGALELTDEFPDAIHKSFSNRKLAAKAYKECKHTGVLDILKIPVHAKENLIVIKGENPGVYNRCTLMKQGLCWHGGKVIIHIGTRYDAQQAFLVLKNNHKTYELPKDKH